MEPFSVPRSAGSWGKLGALKVRIPTSSQASMSEASAAHSAVSSEAASVIEGLKRLREDCNKVAEYNSSLSKAIHKRQEEQGKRAIIERRERNKSELTERVLRLDSDWTYNMLKLVMNAWRLRAYRGRRLLQHFGQDVTLSFSKKRWLSHWQLVNFEKRGDVQAERLLRQREADVSGLQQQLRDVEFRMQEDCRRRDLQRLGNLEMLCCRRLLQTCLAALAANAQEADLQRRRAKTSEGSVSLMSSRRTPRFLQDCLEAWHALATCRPDCSSNQRVEGALERRIALAVSAFLNGQLDRLCKLAFDGWCAVAIVDRNAALAAAHSKVLEAHASERQQVSSAHRNNNLARIAVVRILHCQKNLMADSYRAWARQCVQQVCEAREMKLRLKAAHEAEMAHRREQGEQLWGEAFEASERSALSHIYFLRWVQSHVRPEMESRTIMVLERKRRRDETQKSKSLVHSLQVAQAVMVGGQLLSNLIVGRWQRYAFRVWRAEEKSVEADEERHALHDLRALRAQSAKLTAERDALQETLVSTHCSLMKLRQVSQEVLILWPSYMRIRLLRRSIIAWRLGVWSFVMEHDLEWQERQRIAKDQAWDTCHRQRRDARSLQSAKVLEFAWTSQSLSDVLTLWFEFTCKERHARDSHVLSLEEEARYSQTERTCAETAELVRSRRAKKLLNASPTSHLWGNTFKRGGWMDNLSFLQVVVWSWISCTGSMQKLKIAYQWTQIPAARIFNAGALRRLVETIFSLWVRSARISATQAVNGEAFEETIQSQEEARVEKACRSRILICQKTALIRGALYAWQRLHLDAERQVQEVQAVRQHWSAEEDRARQRFHTSERPLPGLWRLAELSTKRVHATEVCRDVISAWRQESLFGKAENKLMETSREAQTAAEVQHRFETLVCERWRDRSIQFRGRLAPLRELMTVLSAWATVIRKERATRWRQRSLARGMAIASQRIQDLQQRSARILFESWQASVCRARRQWLERRAQWLKAAISRTQVATPNNDPFRSLLPAVQEPLPSPPGDSGVYPLSPLEASPTSPDADFAARLGRFTFGLQ
eukprot:TRINITY_DN11565_c0_g1_i1.p1 TRINITY_DN11565_c0_g1~~TRINITY_DN11565_c0_g1_i1.p1  ORF type:complete len:1059 (+),score=214.91 TRINITY_DN11565_c0_g1_i1:41-3217(+)